MAGRADELMDDYLDSVHFTEPLPDWRDTPEHGQESDDEPEEGDDE